MEWHSKVFHPTVIVFSKLQVSYQLSDLRQSYQLSVFQPIQNCDQEFLARFSVFHPNDYDALIFRGLGFLSQLYDRVLLRGLVLHPKFDEHLVWRLGFHFLCGLGFRPNDGRLGFSGIGFLVIILKRFSGSK
jgi:hypothetical protein